MKKPLVAIFTLVYNHASYLHDYFEGILKQQTDFPFVAIVHDDCSTDCSAEIIIDYASRYPDVIIPILQNENQYSKGVDVDQIVLDVCARTKAKYVAVCEGDDYWIDPLKLQKQVDILEADESLMACCTSCSVVDMKGNVIEEKRIQPVVRDNRQGRYSLRDFFDYDHQYPTLSVVYRNSHVDEIREKKQVMCNPYMTDWIWWIALLCFGDMYYLDEVTCAYRINPTSLTHDKSKMAQRRLGYAKMQFTLQPKVAGILPEHGFEDIKDDLINNTAWKWWNLANAQRKCHQYFQMVYSLIRCLVKNPKYFIEKILGK